MLRILGLDFQNSLKIFFNNLFLLLNLNFFLIILNSSSTVFLMPSYYHNHHHHQVSYLSEIMKNDKSDRSSDYSLSSL
jgi:hypothetical protein